MPTASKEPASIDITGSLCRDPFEGDFGGPLDQVLKNKIVIARKNHKCYSCYDSIHAGDQYHYLVGIYDGEFEQFRFCENCCVEGRK